MSQSAALLQENGGLKIVGVQFGLMDPKVIRRQSVVPIVTPVLYSKQVPESGGMNDLRMGTCDRRTYCATCRNSMIKCPGHFGTVTSGEGVPPLREGPRAWSGRGLQ